MGFEFHAIDRDGQTRTLFMRGYQGVELTDQQAEERARIFCKNWTFVDIKRVASNDPPANPKPFPYDAVSCGAFEQMNAIRRR